MVPNHHVIAPWWPVAENDPAPPLFTLYSIITHACTEARLRDIQNVHGVFDFLKTLNYLLPAGFQTT